MRQIATCRHARPVRGVRAPISRRTSAHRRSRHSARTRSSLRSHRKTLEMSSPAESRMNCPDRRSPERATACRTSPTSACQGPYEKHARWPARRRIRSPHPTWRAISPGARSQRAAESFSRLNDICHWGHGKPLCVTRGPRLRSHAPAGRPAPVTSMPGNSSWGQPCGPVDQGRTSLVPDHLTICRRPGFSGHKVHATNSVSHCFRC